MIRASGHMHMHKHPLTKKKKKNAKNKNEVCLKTAGFGTNVRIVNMKVMSYANLSRFILTNVCLRGAPHLACSLHGNVV